MRDFIRLVSILREYPPNLSGRRNGVERGMHPRAVVICGNENSPFLAFVLGKGILAINEIAKAGQLQMRSSPFSSPTTEEFIILCTRFLNNETRSARRCGSKIALARSAGSSIDPRRCSETSHFGA